MAIVGIVLLVGVVLFVSRWAWRAMKRSPEPEVQSAVAGFERSIAELKAALRKRK